MHSYSERDIQMAFQSYAKSNTKLLVEFLPLSLDAVEWYTVGLAPAALQHT